MLDVQDINTLQRYTKGVIERIGHHGKDVTFAFPAMLGHVFIYGEKIELFGNGTKNAAWFSSKKTGKRYALSYGHPSILLREGSFRGPVVATFDNDTPQGDYEKTFSAL